MPIEYRKTFFLKQETFPYVTIYDEQDIKEVYEKLIDSDKIAISLTDLQLLSSFLSLKKIVLLPGILSAQGKETLYKLKSIEFIAFDYVEDDELDLDRIDVSQFPDLQAIVSRSCLNYINLSQCFSLRTLKVRNCNESDLSSVSGLLKLDSLELTSGKVKSLKGIEKTSIQCLTLSYLRNLLDISTLVLCPNLKALRIDHCPNMTDYENILSKLSNLVLLCITEGKGSFHNLKFIEFLKNLQFFVTDYNILDGQIDLLKKLPYSSILQDRRHYNLKDSELPREKSALRGNENIPLWRRID